MGLTNKTISLKDPSWDFKDYLQRKNANNRLQIVNVFFDGNEFYLS